MNIFKQIRQRREEKLRLALIKKKDNVIEAARCYVFVKTGVAVSAKEAAKRTGTRQLIEIYKEPEARMADMLNMAGYSSSNPKTSSGSHSSD